MHTKNPPKLLQVVVSPVATCEKGIIHYISRKKELLFAYIKRLVCVFFTIHKWLHIRIIPWTGMEKTDILHPKKSLRRVDAVCYNVYITFK